ncbi:unnamed protein product [Microthlaspi erraticum]|uniref:S-locus receptor kinase C-terminal domain-containing protein n=1 Tax=Microthlaspi erraticum TaxID=1685480 RepID=A0A6D2K1C1_9BRAS|nr:unnamed protein product [Microthlaspi erraticum]
MILSVYFYLFLLNVCRLDCFVAVALLNDSHGDTLVSAGERFCYNDPSPGYFTFQMDQEEDIHGLICVQEDPNDRPAISNVVFMLGSSDIATLPNPKQPAFILRLCPSSSKASSSTKPDTCSQNELTITLEDGR